MKSNQQSAREGFKKVNFDHTEIFIYFNRIDTKKDRSIEWMCSIEDVNCKKVLRSRYVENTIR